MNTLSSDQFATFLVLMVIMLVIFVLAVVWSQMGRLRSIRANEAGNRTLQHAADRLIELLRQKEAASYSGIKNELEWARTAISRATGMPRNIRQFPAPLNNTGDPKYLLAEDDSGSMYYFCDVAPEALGKYRPFRWPWQRSKVSLRTKHPLVPLPRGTETYRMSVENISPTFDLEMSDLWKKHLKSDLLMNEIWLYVRPQ